MFEDPTSTTKPLLVYSNYQTLQMIDLWFSHHPLASLLSKTLLLRNYRNDTVDEILLAVILADVLSAQDNTEAQAKGKNMFNWASSELRRVSCDAFDLSHVQALTLLGWYEMCGTRARRSVAYFLHATSLVSRLREPTLCLNQINGVDVGEIEAELARNIRWLTFSVVIWIFMQCDAPLLDLLPSNNASTAFPPMNETMSIVYALDVASDNSSTLPHQAKSIRALWPISHVACTTAHIYVLYPRERGTSALLTPLGTPSWESHTLRRLQCLNEPSRTEPQDYSLMCHKVRHVLLGALKLLESHTEDRTSQNFVLSAYHAMIIHLLFPSKILVGSDREVRITEGLIDDFYVSVRALLRVGPTTDRTEEPGGMLLHDSDSCPRAEVFMLGLDACSRVFAQIQSRSRFIHRDEVVNGDYLASLASDLRVLSKRSDELANLASYLHSLSKHEVLRHTKRSKAVKRQLKEIVRTFECSEDDFDHGESKKTSRSTTSPPLAHDRDTTPGLAHGESTGSSSSASSVNMNHSNTNMIKSIETMDHVYPTLVNPTQTTTETFLLNDTSLSSNQNAGLMFDLNPSNDPLAGYFDPPLFFPNAQDVIGKAVNEGHLVDFGNLEFSIDGSNDMFQSDGKYR